MENLIERYKDSTIKEQFARFITTMKGSKDTNEEIGLKTGDVVSFWGGYNGDIRFVSEILGFNSNGDAYMFWDCYWFGIDLQKREFKIENDLLKTA